MMKFKLQSIQRSIFLLLALLPAVLCAHDFEVNGIFYNINGTNATVTYKGSSYNSYSNEYSGSVSIPATVAYKGTTYTVSSIGNNALAGCTDLTNVSIPNSVTSIGSSAFSGCTGMTSVTIPNSVTSVGNSAFHRCTGLTNVTIPNSIISIGSSTFYGCTGLTRVTIPYSVTSIGQSAFSGCTALKTLNFNAVSCAGFTNAGADKHQFYNTSISTINIGNSVQKIPDFFAYNLTKISNVTIPNSVTSIGNSAFSGCTGLTSVAIPHSVLSVGRSAFASCSGLTYVSLGDNLKTIEDDLFSGCSALTSVSIGKSVKSIDARAFRECISLKSIQIPDSVITICEKAFLNCTQLTYVTIGESVRTIEGTSFSGCTNVKTLDFRAKECNDFTMKSSNNVYPPFYDMPLESIILGNGVKKIPAYFATGHALFSQINIPSSVTNIGNYAFSACGGLKKVTITDILAWLKITFADEYANPLRYAEHLYLKGKELTDLVIPESVTIIKKYAFNHCKSLEYVTIPESVKSIEDYSFSGCSGIVKVVVLNCVPPTVNYTIGFQNAQLVYVPNTKEYLRNNRWNKYNLQGFYSMTTKVTMADIVANDDFKVSKVHLLNANGDVAKSFSAINNMVTLNNIEPNTTSSIIVITSYGDTEISVDDQVTTKLVFSEFKSNSTQTSMAISFAVNRDSGFWIDGCGVECNSKDYNGEIKEMSFDNYTISCKITGLSPNTNYSLRPWVEFNGVKYYGNYISRNTNSIGVSRNGNVGPTSVNYTGTYSAGDAHVTDAYFTFQGENSNKLFKTGLDPLTQYSYYYTVKTTNGDQSNSYSFTTTDLSMTAKAADMITNRDARLMAETNMADEETSCGFEWRRYDAPAEMPSTKVYCPVYGGTMAGTLKNLSENVYYKYRPFYKSSKGNEYYGDWIAFITADAGVVFEPVVYTYSSPEVSQTEATLQGVALRGSDDITEQGFEYWQAGRNNMLTASNVKKVTAKGERMSATVTGLQPGTAYKFRAYAIAGGKATRGAEVDFVTESTGLDVNADGVVNIADMNVIINVILRGNNDRTCDVNGDGLVNISDLNAIISAILAN